ncbi:hypothetical protein SanaruYs_26130 [Chryseotalea sanaruensis]|uniref:DUF4252 domain-containing protein n=1 Tax=Chryseotalea sanaruensis TaxID=2482724 RepID=A0A401UBU9_9BACT|nr:DUF4252 domain-containing protein [Chryseotalea sanaruensis]GCC52376.1 hypothetical protein SanaruYs_26130 [Chryseotalea sanaruensis]
MKAAGIFLTLIFCSIIVSAQSKTTQALHDANKDALALFFYKNTLKMLNQQESKEFDDLIKDIEKMKFLIVSKDESNFTINKFKSLVADYKGEGYEEIMTSRMDGRNFDIYLKEKGGKVAGTVVLVNDEKDLYVLDILGSVPVNKVPQFFQTIDQSSDIGKMIKEFAGDKNKKEEKSEDN